MTLRIALLAGLVALLAMRGAAAETLLVVHEKAAAVDFVDPGSGIRLASVTVGDGPRQISVSPEGVRAVVLSHGTPQRPVVTVSVIDLQQPHEERRVTLPPEARPTGLAWIAPDRVAVSSDGVDSLFIVDPLAGSLVTVVKAGPEPSPGVPAGLQFSSQTTATTRVMPRAVCHACVKQ